MRQPPQIRRKEDVARHRAGEHHANAENDRASEGASE
jgi:hypothetical protein